MNRHPGQAEPPHDVPQEVRSSARRFYQNHLPVRPRQLQDEARDPGAAPDVEDRGGWLRHDREKHERLQDQVSHAGSGITVRGETADPLPPGQLLEVRGDRFRKGGR